MSARPKPQPKPLASHDRYDYSGITERADYHWPDGRRLAVYVAVNLEHFAFGEGLGAELGPGGPPPDVLNYGWRDWGNRVGAWRMLDLLDQIGMPRAVLANSAMYGLAPSLMQAWSRSGAEIVAHGRTNSERQSLMSEAAERAMIAECTDVLAAAGSRPMGWLSPWISESRQTPDLLAEAGYGYTLNWCSDDQPIWLRTRAGPLLAIPYSQEINDIPAIVARKDTPRQFADSIVDAFDEMLLQSVAQPLVFSVALHPYIVAQPHRLGHLRRALQHVAAHRESVWLTTPGRIHAHVAGLYSHIVT